MILLQLSLRAATAALAMSVLFVSSRENSLSNAALAAAASCPGKSSDLELDLGKSVSGKPLTKESFKFQKAEPSGTRQKLIFKGGKDEAVNFVVPAGLKPALQEGKSYQVHRTFFKSIGTSSQSFSVSDEKGLVATYAVSHGNPVIPKLRIEVIDDATCPWDEKSALKEGRASVKWQNAEIATLFAGQSKAIEFEGNKYTIQITQSQLARQVNKNIAFEGTKSRVSYVLVRLK